MSTYAHNPSASKRLTAFVLFVIGVALTVCLFYVKTQSQTAKNEVRSLERAIASEEAAISVLEAELAYRQSPERLSKLSREHLDLAPIAVKNTITLNALSEELPLREAELESVTDD